MANNAKYKIIKEIKQSLDNWYVDNYDHYRYNKDGLKAYNYIKTYIRKTLLKRWMQKEETERVLDNTFDIINKYGSYIEESYDILEDKYSKKLFIKLIAYKILSYRRVKLPMNREEYWDTIQELEEIGKGREVIDFKDWYLQWFELNSMGLDIEVLSRPQNVAHQYFVEQYRYKDIVKVEKGDVVIDGGACWGDTLLYFANKVGENGKVYAFEFIPENIDIIKKNLDANKKIAKRAEIEKKPLWDVDNKKICFKEMGPASRVSEDETENSDHEYKTTTIDSFLENKKREVNLVKLDIEGAEEKALQGAKRTLKNDSPDLAICSYHSLKDFVKMPSTIKNMNGNYDLYLDHATIHWEETVVFASVNSR